MRPFFLTLALTLTLLLVSAAAWAYCTNTTIFGPDGRMQICQTCCDSLGNCQITCF